MIYYNKPVSWYALWMLKLTQVKKLCVIGSEDDHNDKQL